MRRTTIAALAATAAAVAGVALATGVATGTAEDATSGPVKPAHEQLDLTAKRVAIPSAGAPAARGLAPRAKAKKKQKPVRIKYFETPRFDVGNGEGWASRLRCPKKHKVLNGYFASDALDVALTYSVPMSKRVWSVGVTKFGNLSGQPNPAEAILGIVCAQNVR